MMLSYPKLYQELKGDSVLITTKDINEDDVTKYTKDLGDFYEQSGMTYVDVFYFTIGKLDKKYFKNINDDYVLKCLTGERCIPSSLLQHPSIVIAGGCLASIIKGVIFSDIDVYILASSREEYVKVAMFVMRTLEMQRHVGKVRISTNVIEHGSSDWITVQLIKKIYPSITDILESFDIDVCKIAYHQGRIYMSRPAYYTLCTNTIMFCFEKYAKLYDQRVRKYATIKNFMVYIPGCIGIPFDELDYWSGTKHSVMFHIRSQFRINYKQIYVSEFHYDAPPFYENDDYLFEHKGYMINQGYLNFNIRLALYDQEVIIEKSFEGHLYQYLPLQSKIKLIKSGDPNIDIKGRRFYNAVKQYCIIKKLRGATSYLDVKKVSNIVPMETFIMNASCVRAYLNGRHFEPFAPFNLVEGDICSSCHMHVNDEFVERYLKLNRTSIALPTPQAQPSLCSPPPT